MKNKKSLKNKNLIKDSFEKTKINITKNRSLCNEIDNNLSEQEVTHEIITDAESRQEKKPKKKQALSILFFMLNIILVCLVFYNFSREQGGIQPLDTLFANSPKWYFLLVALGLYFITVLLNGCKFLILIHHRTKKLRFNFSVKMAVIGRYYDFVTPLGSGGQPFEIYHLKKNGYSGDTAAAIPLAKYMFWQIAFLIVSLYVLIFHGTMTNSTLVVVCAWIGVSICLALFLFVFFMSTTKKWGASLVVGVLKLLHKMKIIKDYRKTLRKVLRFVKQYQLCIKSFAKSPLTVISMTLISILSLVAHALIAYYIYIAFVDLPRVSAYEIVCKCFICELASSFFPMPGGSGAQELSFNALLGTLFTEGTLFWGILIWRILTYYIYVAHGGIVIIIDGIKSKFKNKRNKADIPMENNNKNKDEQLYL